MTPSREDLRATALAALCAVITLLGCNGRGGDYTPLPRAYPRIEIADSAHHTFAPDTLPVHIEINDRATAIIDSTSRNLSTIWLTINYPTYRNSRIYITMRSISGTALDKAIDNRRERMALNAGDTQSELIMLENPYGFRSEILLTRRGSITPIQFISSNDRRLISGACYIADAATAPDSVAPVVDGMLSDVLHIVKTIR
ncbi:MAG: hypothetical protein NC043_08950 [Muribaculaceae bacterium]|nr:hypothetical protein [Muribaculaceae bacterium]